MAAWLAGDISGFNQDPRRRLLIKGATVVSLDPDVGDLNVGDVLVGGEEILAVAGDLSSSDAARGATVLDADGLIAMPGFTDGHRHCWQGQLKRLLPDLDSPDAYLVAMLEGIGPCYEPADIYAGTLISALTALDAGITTVVDFCHNVRTTEHARAAVRAHRESGIRAVFAACAPWSGEWDGQWPTNAVELRDELAEDPLVTVRLALAASTSYVPHACLSPASLAFARDHDLGVTVDGVIGPPSAALIEQLDKEKVLGPDITLLHCIDLTEAAWDAIECSGVGVVLAGTSDAMIGMGGGSFPVQTCLDRGLWPGLSIDVEVSLASDMFSQMRGVLQHQRLGVHERRYGGAGAAALLTVRAVLEMATAHGQRSAGLHPPAGRIGPGRAADLVLLQANEVNMIPANNVIGSIVLGADTGNVHSVLVGGRVRKFDGRLVGVDRDALRATVERSRDDLLARSGLALERF